MQLVTEDNKTSVKICFILRPVHLWNKQRYKKRAMRIDIMINPRPAVFSSNRLVF